MSDIVVRSRYLQHIAVGKLAAKLNAAGNRVLRYYIDLKHRRLNLHKELSAPELFILQSKVDALVAIWDEKFDQQEQQRQLRSNKESADELTEMALARLDSLSRVLSHTLKVNDRIDWEALKDHSKYPTIPNFRDPKPSYTAAPKPFYATPSISLLDWLFGKKSKKLEIAQYEHQQAVSGWQKQEIERQAEHDRAVFDWEQRKQGYFAAYNRKKEEFLAEQAARNAKVDDLRNSLKRGDTQAVIEHASMVLEASNYDDLFEKSYVVQYDRESNLLMVEFDLPAPDSLPATKSVKFNKGTGELKEAYITEREQKSNFESVAYQICLRTLHELFEADEASNIKKILFNGFVGFIDRSTGQDARSCLLSVLVDRSTFSAIDLSRVQPKDCFKSLKGVSAASLASLTPIPPVMRMDREDRRFIEGREVGSTLNDETNLSSISWDDFEHLVRELFEKEFRSRGGEVKVTQASSDGGVDAVAFDPDPISGGKIVIQAKRYTKTVGVSAVRDLYGTVMNEGASKGILVTTADYGPDAYKFANGKPLTLMNGANLLHLLERHGYRARIDLRESRDVLSRSASS